MELRDKQPQWEVLPQFAQLLLEHGDDLDDYQDELRRLAYWVVHENCNQQAVNRRLAEYATRQREEEGNSHETWESPSKTLEKPLPIKLHPSLFGKLTALEML